ncbi:universal stress protein [Microvirga sp. BT689]|uniref:universal stress protein n=1 Tax=Microvirga arvi TaxID=2778731 RepID=UPI001951FC2A|nr:universal stress protein [Microvirga arvi]MBM6581695.1 universal stress protein [Microvirga arvi]
MGLNQSENLSGHSAASSATSANPEFSLAYGLPFRTVLVPVDLTHPETAELTIELATAVAHAAGGTVHLIYVLPALPLSAMGSDLPLALADEVQREAEQELAILAATTHLPDEALSISVHAGSVCDEVLREAEKIGADLIIVGSHRPSMASYLLGSNAGPIVRHSKCSVLVMR